MHNVPKNELGEYLFHQGTNYRAYDYLGAHKYGDKMIFRVWAPSALSVFLAGDFNGWGYDLPLYRANDGGVWEIAVARERLGESFAYKYIIRSEKGDVYKADPYARYSECPPATASVYFDTDGYRWHDDGWMAYRREKFARDNFSYGFYKNPINIYELHAGSWKRHEDGSYYTWHELGEELAPYAKQMGYTHIELLPVMEHPFDGSWGYQVCGHFAATARFGTPHDLMAFVDKMHSAGIGVILDWVPAHFPKDEHGLYEFDGAPLYEYQGKDRMEHKGWGTRCFDVGRPEVQSFLVSSADYWIRNFHADGLRVDAVASMLYLDYDRMPGEWVPNVYGDNRNLEAEAFFKKLNSHINGEFPDVMMIAEESSNWANLTGNADEGLGFAMKWDMGWMNDTLSYVSLDPIYRKYEHNKLTFSMMYAFGERYTMPISHDEVVHGKRSLLNRMPGSYEEKFAGVRAFMGYMMTHPGKKLMFMGGEFGQFIEWKYNDQLDWFLLDYEKHARLQRYFADINHFYLENPELWEEDSSWEGFQWIDADNRDLSVISYRRLSAARRGKRSELYVIVNFTPVERKDFRVKVEAKGRYKEVFNSDAVEYGGWGTLNSTPVESYSASGTEEISITLPPLSVVILKKQTAGRKRSIDSPPVSRL